MGKAVIIGVLIIIAIFAGILITVHNRSSKMPEIASENLAEMQARALGSYALTYGIKKIANNQIIFTQGTYLDNQGLNVLDGRIDSIRYYRNATEDTVHIFAYLYCDVCGHQIHHQSEALIELAINRHPDEQVGFWNMDEGNGNIANDDSKNDYYGTMNNMDTTSVWEDGKYGSAIHFDGDNDYISLDSTGVSSTYDDVLTIATWVKIDPEYLFGDAGLLLSERDISGSSNEKVWRLWSYARKGKFDWLFPWLTFATFGFDFVTDNGTEGVYITKNKSDMDVFGWHYIVATYDGSEPGAYATISIQIVDVEDAKETETIHKWTRRDSTNTVYIGGRLFEAEHPLIQWLGQNLSSMGGMMDEMMIFNDILSENQIYDLYRYNGFRTPNVIYWQE